MRALKKYRILIIIVLVAAAAAGFLWIRSYLFTNIGLSIHDRLQSLELSGFNVKYDSLTVDWRKNAVRIYGLLLERNPYDTTCMYPEFLSVGRVTAEGIRLLPLVFSHVLDVERFQLDRPRLVMRENTALEPDSSAQRENEFTLKTNRVAIRSADFEYYDSAGCALITGIRSHITIDDLELDFRVDKPFRYSAGLLAFDSTQLRLPGENYTIDLKNASMNFTASQLKLDSLMIHPDLGKTAFGRKRGYEVDRIEGVVPYLRLDGITWSRGDSLQINTKLAEVQFYLKLFRDKRLPFRKVAKSLPFDALRELSFGLKIDSLKVVKSYVQYEEFPEEGTEPGGIFFDNLYATLTNIDNASREGQSRLIAGAAMMGKGSLEIDVTFPLAPKKSAALRGSLKNFPIPSINPMLTPSTNMKVESGDMKDLSFNFTFNDTRSDGEVALNYENLKLISFKEEEKKTGEGDAPEKDNLKTFIMNTFIFRKNMDEDVPEEKRTGTIAYLRDENRSIFNFWTKSLLSGLKSAYNLDKTEAKKSEREIRKEERLARRLERKQKKAEKKRERG